MTALRDDERYAELLAGDFPEPSELVQEQLACPTRPVYRPRPAVSAPPRSIVATPAALPSPSAPAVVEQQLA